jgi:hypothetical protein
LGNANAIVVTDDKRISDITRRIVAVDMLAIL